MRHHVVLRIDQHEPVLDDDAFELDVARVAALAIASTLLLSPHSASADQRDFTLVNNSRITITQLYVSPTSSDRWGTDQLGSNVVAPGERFTLRFPVGADGGTCMYDLKIVRSDGASFVESNVNLCTVATVTHS